MPDDLATAAVFGDLTQAQAARLCLEAEGVPAFLADENVAGSIFVWSAAVGGIKLQVPASRLEESLRILDEQMPSAGYADTSDFDDQPPPEDEPPAEEPSPTPADSKPEGPTEEPTLRERRVDSLTKAALVGIVFVPALLFAFWRLMQVWLSDERLRPEYQRRATLAAAFVVPFTTLLLVVWKLMCCAGVGG